MDGIKNISHPRNTRAMAQHREAPASFSTASSLCWRRRHASSWRRSGYGGERSGGGAGRGLLACVGITSRDGLPRTHGPARPLAGGR